jgi:EmrB/QacA subfamily drug resistance transporter
VLEYLMTSPASAAPTGHPDVAPAHPRRWLGLVLLCAAQFMLILDVTVVNVALPQIGADLHLHRVALTWVLTAYTVTFGGLMLLGGRLADLFGARRMLLIGLAIFTGASLVNGLAGNAVTLLGGRAAQGVGAALLSPAALSLVSTMFTGTERARALGVWAAIGGGGSAIGVIVGGVLTSAVGWPWVFFVNVPIGAAVLLALPSVVPAADRVRDRTRLDVPGAVMVTAGTGAVIYGLTNAGSSGWLAPATLIPLVVGVGLYAVFAIMQRVVAVPLMDLRILARRPVAAGALLMLVATGVLVGSYFLASFYLQRVQGHGALATGLLFLPVAVSTILGAHGASNLVTRVDSRVLVAAALALAATGTSAAGTWSGTAALVAALTMAGLGIGAAFVAAFTTALAHIDPAATGVGSGILNTFHELGGAVGVAVLSSIAVTSLTGTRPGGAGFAAAYLAAALAALATAVLATLVVPAGRPAATAMTHGH